MWRKEFNFRLVWGLLDAEIKTETQPHQPEVLKGRLLKPVFWGNAPVQQAQGNAHSPGGTGHTSTLQTCRLDPPAED